MSAALVVWIEGVRVGLLGTDQGRWLFHYEPEWLSSPHRFPLSPHLPLTASPLEDDADDRRVEWFFDNLLPEGGVREALAKYVNLAAQDAFGLLSRFGEESAGALTLLPEGAACPAAGSYRPLPREELVELLATLPDLPLIAAGGRARMSLAGAQHKVGLHRRAEDDLFLLPEGAASSLIVKPDNARATEFPFCPANEHFCMNLARRLGLAVPPTELLHLPDPIYLVRRFDRVTEAGHVRRLHQIDLCQLLNKWAGYKYESDGGITLQQAFAALEHTRQPAVSRGQLLRWLFFNYLIGNSDAHAKNIAFLVSEAGLTLAPAYDLLSVAAYGPAHDFMAMTIADEPRYGWIEATHWTTLGRTIGVSPVFIKKLGRQLASTVPAAARQLLAVDSGSMQPDEQAFVTKIVETIERHAGYLLESTT